VKPVIQPLSCCIIEPLLAGDLNISAINYGDKLPKYGNLVTIPLGNVDPVRYAAWHGDEIDLYMKDAGMYKPSDYINKGGL
jgi:hypothetical protein